MDVVTLALAKQYTDGRNILGDGEKTVRGALAATAIE